VSGFDRRKFCISLSALLAHRSALTGEVRSGEIALHPTEYTGALRNPLKGLRSSDPASAKNLPYASLAKSYIKWSDLEDNAKAGKQRIRDFCDAQWAGLSSINTKVIPRVYLDWPPNGHYWPADLPRGDYESAQFQQRAVALIEKLGECWDNDPRVAFVETGIVGLWGEQHDPSPSLALQKVLGDAFTSNFRRKLLMNRYPGHFTDYNFGIYWDSFGHKEEISTHMPLLTSAHFSSRWKTAPMGGETAFDWGTPLGKNPTDALVHNADTIIQLIRELHWNHLGWLSNYDRTNPVAVANAARVQDALGYRFVLDEVRFTASLRPGNTFQVSMSVRNTGSSPLYYPWPLEVSLLDKRTRMPRWKALFQNVDLRTIVSGSPCAIRGEFSCPSDIPKGEYLLALSILDPAGERPAVRFATTQYFKGGRHPIGWIGVNQPPTSANMPVFDDPALDDGLFYGA
jgi:hypothetical protein